MVASDFSAQLPSCLLSFECEEQTGFKARNPCLGVLPHEHAERSIQEASEYTQKSVNHVPSLSGQAVGISLGLIQLLLPQNALWFLAGP